MCAHVLVAEDDEKQADVLRRYLLAEGHTVVLASDGRAAIDYVRAHRPDLLVLDVMMPGVDGMDVCRILRRESDVLVLMLTARTSEDDLLLGLDLGADDYMTKPYSPRELTTRVRTLLRRVRQETVVADDEQVLCVGPLLVDPARHEVTMAGRAIDCTPGEFRVITAMAKRPGRVFTRPQLLGHARGDDSYVTERTIDVHISNLRKKIEPDPQRPAHLVTVFGVGYKLVSGDA
ncbi:DNA-binding response regulator [Actinosynnema sp. ALI-1.44]|uniref:response regulator transcription factor n=1 Tax=Actinosynnema sp. ALI-1.44 TaxID=1933779 RepID=UPI00097BE832|nr:response regulator transcription factor [Actinosynnema sp. ALI-1.44]ONI86916.1 DNA-binding response regulator [Actinosynnema sp. ALI-1.44]